MLALISPAKKLLFPSSAPKHTHTQPLFKTNTLELITILQEFSKEKLQDLMGLSDKLAKLNVERFQAFSKNSTEKNAQQVILAFAGDTYQGLKADTFDKQDLNYAQEHLLILSGLYGLLRPLDLIQPHRLEMGTKLSTHRGKNLYDFWGSSLLDFCVKKAKEHRNPTLVFLASNEYLKVLNVSSKKGLPHVTCHFKEEQNGTLKTIGLFAKKARGMMARFMLQNRLETPNDLKEFQSEGYIFSQRFLTTQ
ncbi:uncharacterized protein LOC111320160, partial [Stylophora pistillata]|uniref:uncharacterized protein LOC111320160 n=1 Tax=Stylophora pistillata TaxID=50429 RepID=UPI000C046756